MKNQVDFTEGSLVRKMLLFSGPIFLTNLLQTSYQFIDSLWVGNLLGAGALGAISIASVIVFAILSFIIGINSATLTVLSQQKGKNDLRGLKESLNSFVVILFILSIFSGILGYICSETFLRILQTPKELFVEAKTYLQLNFFGILFLFGYNFIGTVLRSLGDSKTPILFVLIAVILNAIFDPLFIAVFDLGIAGAAYATILSQGLAFFIGLIYSIKVAKVPFIKPHLPKVEDVKMVLKLGIPSGFQMIAISSGVLAIMSVVTVFGEDVVAGFGAAQRIESIMMLPAFALSAAVNSMGGQNIGAEKWDRVFEIAKLGVSFILVIMIIISTFVFLFGEHLIRLFVDDNNTISFGSMYLKIVAFFYPFLGINFVLNGIVRASGAMFQVLVLNILSFWVLRYPFSKLGSILIGESGIALGMGLSLVISSILSFLYFRYGNWRNIKLLKETA